MITLIFPKDFVKVDNKDYRVPVKGGGIIRLCVYFQRACLIHYSDNDTMIDLKPMPDHIFTSKHWVVNAKFNAKLV